MKSYKAYIASRAPYKDSWEGVGEGKGLQVIGTEYVGANSLEEAEKYFADIYKDSTLVVESVGENLCKWCCENKVQCKCR